MAHAGIYTRRRDDRAFHAGGAVPATSTGLFVADGLTRGRSSGDGPAEGVHVDHSSRLRCEETDVVVKPRGRRLGHRHAALPVVEILTSLGNDRI